MLNRLVTGSNRADGAIGIPLPRARIENLPLRPARPLSQHAAARRWSPSSRHHLADVRRRVPELAGRRGRCPRATLVKMWWIWMRLLLRLAPGMVLRAHVRRFARR